MIDKCIVINKNVLTQELDNFGLPTHINFVWKRVPILGKKQLVDILSFEAEQRIKEKYFQKEVSELLKEIKLVKPSKKELKKILRFVKFI